MLLLEIDWNLICMSEGMTDDENVFHYVDKTRCIENVGMIEDNVTLYKFQPAIHSFNKCNINHCELQWLTY